MKKRARAPKYGRMISYVPVKRPAHFCNGFVPKAAKVIMRS
jgi:hypothetical protein